tara:strand:+ start:225 stop:452 length:228 start_codon:yes stop_codon:yes gene_type:complete
MHGNGLTVPKRPNALVGLPFDTDVGWSDTGGLRDVRPHGIEIWAKRRSLSDYNDIEIAHRKSPLAHYRTRSDEEI